MLHLGHRNLTFNPYTLAGHTFLGAGVELTPKKWRFAAMYGRLRQGLEIDTATNTVRIPTFRRKGYGFKVGYGSETNFIDLMYFHAKDDSTSITTWKDPKIMQELGDAAALRPAENNVFGVSSLLTLWKKLTFQADGAISLFNANIADTLGSEPKMPVAVNSSTTLKWAGKASLGYNFGDFQLRTEYERILPGYLTMGSYFFNNDMENITIAPSGVIAKGKVNFAGAIGLQRNNLDENKLETTKRFIGNGNISFNPTQVWGVNMSYNNFGIQTTPLNLPVNDSTRIRQVNQTLVITPRVVIARDTSSSHNLSLNFSMNDVNDRNIITRQYGNMQATMISLNHISSFTRNASSINTGLNYNSTKMFMANNTQLGFTVGYSRSFFDNALNLSLSNNFNLSNVNGERDGTVLNSTATLSYALKNRHSFNLNANVIKTTSLQYENFTETMGTIGYNYRIK
jgi:hypothetical protein